MAGADHGTGKIDAVGGATGKGSAVAILTFGPTSHRRAGEQDKIVAGGIGVALNALSPWAAAAWHFGSIDPNKAHALAATTQRVAVGHGRRLALDRASGALPLAAALRDA